MKTHKITGAASRYTWCDRLVSLRIKVSTLDSNVTCLRCLGEIGDRFRATAGAR